MVLYNCPNTESNITHRHSEEVVFLSYSKETADSLPVVLEGVLLSGSGLCRVSTTRPTAYLQVRAQCHTFPGRHNSSLWLAGSHTFCFVFLPVSVCVCAEIDTITMELSNVNICCLFKLIVGGKHAPFQLCYLSILFYLAGWKHATLMRMRSPYLLIN